jgi:hypothetical protein
MNHLEILAEELDDQQLMNPAFRWQSRWYWGWFIAI